MHAATAAGRPLPTVRLHNVPSISAPMDGAEWKILEDAMPPQRLHLPQS